jgi:membrane-associated phospholipid phosphatase
MLKKISIIDAINLLFWLVMTFFMVITFNKTPYKTELIISYPLLLIFYFYSIKIRTIESLGKIRKVLAFLLPATFFFLIFETLFMILPYSTETRYDTLLAQIDLALFGISPTVWIEQYIQPIFTEILYIAYFLYFPMPLLVFGWMFYKRQYRSIEKYFFIFLLTYYSAYTCYFLFPAVGPRFFLADQYSIPLQGLYFTNFLRTFIDTLEPNKLDAFPSLHTAILITTMILAYKNSKFLFYIYIPIGILILISVIYCRYHYFIDVIAGVVCSLISYWAAYRIYYRYRQKFSFHFGEQA